MDGFLRRAKKVQIYQEVISVKSKMQKLRYGLTAVLSQNNSGVTNKIKQNKVSQIIFFQKKNKKINTFQTFIVIIDQNMRRSVLLVKTK